MKILLTNHHLINFGGTEAFTLELAKGLKQNGHKVVVYSKFIGELAPLLTKEAIPYTSNLSLIQNQNFDLSHVHHNISALEIRNTFPNLPIFYLSHGAAHFLEQPPQLELNIALFGAVSEGIALNMNKSGIPRKKLVVFRNIVNEQHFYPKTAFNSRPKKALILSAKIDEKKETVIRASCKQLAIKATAVGGRFGEVPYRAIAGLIQKADIVFTIGRGVVETMMCGKIPVVFDVFGGDGMVTPDNFALLMRRNFSGKSYKKNYTVRSLVKEIKKYDKNNPAALSRHSFEEFSTARQIPRIERIYKKTIALHKRKKINKAILDTYINTIKASVYYQSRMGKSQLEMEYTRNKDRLDKITSSKFFKLYPLYEEVKKYFIR